MKRHKVAAVLGTLIGLAARDIVKGGGLALGAVLVLRMMNVL